MTTPEILTLIAIVIGPIAAVQIQKYLEHRKFRLERKLLVFKTLMATRGLVLAPDHVQALNLIDIEFYGDRKYRRVLAAWRLYLDHLATDEPVDDAGWDRWNERRRDLLVDLIYEMGVSLKYNFDRVQLMRAFYSPKGHSQMEQEQNALRRGLVELLAGSRALPMDVRSFPEMELTPDQQAANRILLALAEQEQRRLNPPPDRNGG